MTTRKRPNQLRPEDEYEDLLGLWSDLESCLALLLSQPLRVQDFPLKIKLADDWLQDLVAHDIDAALYLMFQLAGTSTVGYSASHALVCATLCHIVAKELKLPQSERDSLVRAAFTMNIGMTRLQDELAIQRERPTALQQDAIRSHPLDGHAILDRLFVADPLWLEIVAQHHNRVAQWQPIGEMAPVERLSTILGTIDRYAAMISPRKSREGRSATDSARAIVGQDIDQRDQVSYALVRSVGLCPPGTFVKLDNGDTAVVLRRSDKPNQPLVASLADTEGTQRTDPMLHETSNGSRRIQSALARSAVNMELNHRTMVRLGLYAARHTAETHVRDTQIGSI